MGVILVREEPLRAHQFQPLLQFGEVIAVERVTGRVQRIPVARRLLLESGARLRRASLDRREAHHYIGFGLDSRGIDQHEIRERLYQDLGMALRHLARDSVDEFDVRVRSSHDLACRIVAVARDLPRRVRLG